MVKRMKSNVAEKTFLSIPVWVRRAARRLAGLRSPARRRLWAAAAVLVVALWSCGDGNKGEGSLGAGDLPDQEFTDFTTMESDSGVTTWILKAPVARVYNSRKLLVTDEPRIEFYDETGDLSSVLTAAKAEYNQVTKDLTALGTVVVTSREGYTLETESLIWVNDLEEIHTEDFVTFTRGRDILTGYGLRSDPELAKVEIQRDIKAYLTDDEGIVDEEVRKESAGGHGERQGDPSKEAGNE
jgi:LPS export ABC transporter protein LptC